jgi:hypothetical protein
MSEMFEEAVSFSGKGLGSWVVSNVMYMYSMVRRKVFRRMRVGNYFD